MDRAQSAKGRDDMSGSMIAPVTFSSGPDHRTADVAPLLQHSGTRDAAAEASVEVAALQLQSIDETWMGSPRTAVQANPSKPTCWHGLATGGDLRISCGAVFCLVTAPAVFCLVTAPPAACVHLLAVCTWLLASCQMFLYVCLLMPGFIQMVAFYIFSSQVTKSVRYGPGPRRFLDLYWPRGAARKLAGPGEPKLPVVIYITGGAWVLGNKAWGAMLGRRLAQQGILVACLDYRNFPQASVVPILEDVNTGIAWVMANIESYGGDSGSITLVGQSAGAHLGALAMFQQAEQMCSGKTSVCASPCWNPKELHAFLGVSGVYDLPALSQHLQSRGLGRNLLDGIMVLDGRPALVELSPLEVAKNWSVGSVDLLPDLALLHGTADKSAPHEGACRLHRLLKDLGVPCDMQLLEGKGHTFPILEGAMRGGHDVLVDKVLSVALGQTEGVTHAMLNLGCMCTLAGYVCPF